MHLTLSCTPSNILGMAHTFLTFDFGNDEEAAQKARHRIEGWRQGFRLDKKLQVKFDRKETETALSSAAPAPAPSKQAAKGKGKAPAKGKSKSEPAPKETSEPSSSSQIRLIVRLDFSDHEKLSSARWLERIPADELFKSASPKIVRSGDPEFQSTSELFDSLD